MSALQIIQAYLKLPQYPVKSFWDTETKLSKLTVIVMGDLILKPKIRSHNKNSLNLLMGEADHQLI